MAGRPRGHRRGDRAAVGRPAGPDGRRHRVGVDADATATATATAPASCQGGEQQRVAFARALANDPPVLLADEPTANTEASCVRDLARLLRLLADEDGRSVVIVSHDDRLREVADRVLWLEDGTFRQVATLTVDPACRIRVEPTGVHTDWRGHRCWFCSEACRREFVTLPERFTIGTT